MLKCLVFNDFSVWLKINVNFFEKNCKKIWK